MKLPDTIDRRTLLCQIAAGLSLTPALVPVARAATSASAGALLPESDPAARAVHYVEDASKSKEAASGATCADCSIYGAITDSEGTCTLFKDRRVKAAGWCTSWSGL